MKLKVDAYEAWPHSATVRVTDLDTGATAEATAKTALKARLEAIRKLEKSRGR
jgi:hypothetical protein